MRLRSLAVVAALVLSLPLATAARQSGVIRVPLSYGAPADGPKPNFSPKGTQVRLTPVDAAIPADAARPAMSGTIEVGPDKSAWIKVLATADAAHPQDLCRLYLDRNRNGRFDDDGPALTAAPAQNEKTKAWWTSINKVELSIPYRAGDPERYMVNFWLVREGDEPPAVLRYSVSSWRTGRATIDGVEALVAAMDSNNDAVFDKDDQWSVIEASAPEAARVVLTHQEARPTARLMYVKDGSRELVLEFRSFSPDGRAIEFSRVDRPTTKAADRAGDDVLVTERARPRAATPFEWGHGFDAALARARASGRKVLVDFEATWCGPCKTMDEWIWTDAEVASLLASGYVGVKLDGDIEKALVKRFDVAGYPTMIVLDPAGSEAHRAVGYLSSSEAIAFLKK